MKSKVLVAKELGTRTEEVAPGIRRRFPKESEELGAWRSGPSLVGLTEGVNDESATLVEGFVPTRYELAELARHYLNEALGIEHWWEISDQSGSSEARMKAFAGNRLIHHHIERRNTIRSYHQKAVIAQIVRVPDFSAV